MIQLFMEPVYPLRVPLQRGQMTRPHLDEFSPKRLIELFTAEILLLHLLFILDTTRSPGNSIQALCRNRLSTDDTSPICAFINALERILYLDKQGSFIH